MNRKLLFLCMGVISCNMHYPLLHADAENVRNTTVFLASFNNPLLTENDLIAFFNAYPIDVHAKDEANRTALILAAMQNYENLTQLLIANNAPVNAQDSHKRTALMFAAWMGNANNVTALLKAKAKKNLKDRFGKIAKDYATMKTTNLVLAQQGKKFSPDDARIHQAQASFMRSLMHVTLQRKGQLAVATILS